MCIRDSVQLARSDTQSGESLVLVAGLNGLARVTDQGLQLGLHGLVTNAALLVGEDALLLGLNVCHSRISP